MGNNDYYVDLLFYHRELQCLVAIDLKIDDFKPEYMGKMDFYLEVLDRDIKKPHENPSVGMILCKNADTDVVEYSLSRSLSQTMIAEYKTKLIDKSILLRKLAELYDIAEENDKGIIGCFIVRHNYCVSGCYHTFSINCHADVSGIWGNDSQKLSCRVNIKGSRGCRCVEMFRYERVYAYTQIRACICRCSDIDVEILTR